MTFDFDSLPTCAVPDGCCLSPQLRSGQKVFDILKSVGPFRKPLSGKRPLLWKCPPTRSAAEAQ